MTEVEKIASYFLKVVNRDSGEVITHLKLQKLVYYAQGWHLVFTGKPLFEQEIQAWIHGPVCPTLYSKYKDYKWEAIPEPDEMPDLDLEVLETLEAVWDAYGHLSAKYLEELTHQERPWIKAREKSEPGDICKNPISLEEMKMFYTELNRND